MDKQLQDRIRSWMEAHKQEMIADLASLVKIKSVSQPGQGGYAMGEGCARCAEAVMELGKKWDFIPQNHDYYCVSLTMKGTTDREIGILGHMDVVPEGEGWSFPPYGATLVDDYMIGRGAGDNKGACVMSLYAMRCIRELGIPMASNIRLIMGFNEEAGMLDVEHYVKTMPLPRFTIVCDGAWPMITGEKGILTANLRSRITSGNLAEFQGGISSNSVPSQAFARVITNKKAADFPPAEGIQAEDTTDGIIVHASGKACHAMAPEGGVNAIHRLCCWLLDSGLLTGDCVRGVSFIRRVTSDYYGGGLDIAFEDGISGKTTCIGGMASLADSTITLNINVRYAIEADRELQKANLLAACDRSGFAVEDFADSAPRYMSAEEEPTAGLLELYRQMTGDMSQPIIMGGGTHARKFPRALPYGPGHWGGGGRFGGAHSVDEAVYLPHLTEALPIYVEALLLLDRHFGD